MEKMGRFAPGLLSQMVLPLAPTLSGWIRRAIGYGETPEFPAGLLRLTPADIRVVVYSEGKSLEQEGDSDSLPRA